jgi:hypothetical protein
MSDRQDLETGALACGKANRRRRPRDREAEAAERFLAREFVRTQVIAMRSLGAAMRLPRRDPRVSPFLLDHCRLSRLNLRLYESLGRLCDRAEDRKAASRRRARINRMLVTLVNEGALEQDGGALP